MKKKSTVKNSTCSMTRDQVEKMLLDIVEEVDHDSAKNLDPDCAEGGPAAAEEFMNELVNVVTKHVNIT